ncbi:helix-turn-helix domain-containing protein [Actinokineospora enzanensis]|uniref:helix-turn-helix domain-containing protein n=1 Tax=Actinokineospora enzanensis TaxID=155975 RepID=UPI0003748243|nr:helix-turn-helix transcriptional regulator [Actinokineospora enzanensis]
MNTGTNDSRAPIDPVTWEDGEMRAALACHDMRTVFFLLRRVGVTQRRIAALTGLSQPEVSRILGGRQVQSYAVLARIADGLAVPRGLMGLVYAPEVDPDTVDGAIGLALYGARVVEEGGAAVQRRAFIALVAQAAIAGLSEPDLARLAQVSGSSAMAVSPVGRVGDSDAAALEDTVSFLRAQDNLSGGGAVRAAATGYLDWAGTLANAPATDIVHRRIQIARADLYSVAGWSAFDAGDHATARRQLATGLAIAKDADQPDLAATALYELGRVFLHANDPDGALKCFQLGQAAAQDADSPYALALVQINSAWAYSEMGKPQHVSSLLARASEELERARGDAPSWLGFMGHAEIHGITGMCYTALSARDRTYAESALEHASLSYHARPESEARSRASDLLAMAAANFRAGDPDAGCRTAHDALALASTVRSSRLTDRQAWIAQGASLYPRHAGARDLVATLATV